MTIQFQLSHSTAPPLFVHNEIVEKVTSYKYLGTIIDHKFIFQLNTAHIFLRCQQRFFFLHKFRKLQVQQSILLLFINVSLNPFNKIIRICGKIIGQEQQSLTAIFNSGVIPKGNQIASDHCHTLNTYYTMLPSGCSYKSPMDKESHF